MSDTEIEILEGNLWDVLGVALLDLHALEGTCTVRVSNQTHLEAVAEAHHEIVRCGLSAVIVMDPYE